MARDARAPATARRGTFSGPVAGIWAAALSSLSESKTSTSARLWPLGGPLLGHRQPGKNDPATGRLTDTLVASQLRTLMKTRKSTMRCCKVAAFALIVVAPMSVSLAQAASDCSTLKTLTDWGENSTSYIDLRSGESCLFRITKRGTVSSSDISQKPDTAS